MNIKKFGINYGQDTINSLSLENLKSKLDKSSNIFQKSKMIALYTFAKNGLQFE